MDQATEYARGVVEGRIVAGRLVRLAAERHLRDLDEGAARGLWWDVEEAEDAIAYCGVFRQRKGRWQGQPLAVQGWQAFVIGSVFGWQRWDHELGRWVRRFTRVWVCVPRKQGKTTIAAPVGLRLAWDDGEPGAEVYAVATKQDQARIAWSEAVWMARHAPEKYRARLQFLTSNMHCIGTASKFEPLGADEHTLDGLNPHGVIADEVHKWKNPQLWDVMENATQAREQPVIFAITTAGNDRNTICYELDQRAIQILEGIVDNDAWFVFVARIDDEAKWDDIEELRKAQVSFGVTVRESTIREAVENARQLPSRKSAFLRDFANVWVQAENRWLNMELWAQQGAQRPIEELRGKRCWAGLDLSQTTDLSALALVFDDGPDAVDVLVWYWVPEERVMERVKSDSVPYDVWTSEGPGDGLRETWIETTPGNVIDYDRIRAKLNELRLVFDIEAVAVDPHNAHQLMTQLEMEDGFTVVKVPQTMQRLTAPVKEVERLFIAGGLRHGDNPVLRWNAANAVAVTNSGEDIRLDKARSAERIDGMAALVDAMSERLVAVEQGIVFWVPPAEKEGDGNGTEIR